MKHFIILYKISKRKKEKKESCNPQSPMLPKQKGNGINTWESEDSNTYKSWSRIKRSKQAQKFHAVVFLQPNHTIAEQRTKAESAITFALFF
jgi:hypothetical protein